jgi:hypothetical protein
MKSLGTVATGEGNVYEKLCQADVGNESVPAEE